MSNYFACVLAYIADCLFVIIGTEKSDKEKRVQYPYYPWQKWGIYYTEKDIHWVFFFFF